MGADLLLGDLGNEKLVGFVGTSGTSGTSGTTSSARSRWRWVNRNVPVDAQLTGQCMLAAQEVVDDPEFGLCVHRCARC